jgi:hypothetical protein
VEYLLQKLKIAGEVAATETVTTVTIRSKDMTTKQTVKMNCVRYELHTNTFPKSLVEGRPTSRL